MVQTKYDSLSISVESRIEGGDLNKLKQVILVSRPGELIKHNMDTLKEILLTKLERHETQ